jgi:hypothetical protein
LSWGQDRDFYASATNHVNVTVLQHGLLLI